MKTKRIILSALLLACLVILCACSFGNQTHTITFVDYDGTQLLELTVEDGQMPEYTLDDPTRESTAQFTYTFIGWDKMIAPATEDVTYQAVYKETVNKYTVTFVDEDGSVLESKELEYGKMPSYSGRTPVKESTDANNYVFAGWDKELVAVTGNATYTATYDEAKNEYQIVFRDLEGNILQEGLVEFGTLPVYNGEEPFLAGDDQYSYVFVGWTPELVPVVGQATYRPVFDQIVNEYTVTFVDENGEVLQSGKVAYGTTPVFEGNLPLPEGDAQYEYHGSWDKEISAVTGDATYTYVVTKTKKVYTVTFMNGDTVLDSKSYEYGQTPSFDRVPYKANTKETVYTFAGWDKTISAVEGNATYNAVYTEAANSFDLVISHVSLDGFVVSDAYTADVTDGELCTYTAPVVDGLTASHQYIKYCYDGEKLLFTVYYSEVSVWDGTSVSNSFAGEGTAENPYLITSGADLALLRANVNAGETYAGKYFKMTKSIDLNSVSLMIGKSEAASFAGILDGNNCALLNMKTQETTTGQYSGLFKWLLAGGKVCNLSTYGHYNHVIKMNGTIVGRNHGTIENCTNYISITPADGVTPAELHRYTGGIASVNFGSIISCVNYGDITGEEYASGIVSRIYEGSIVENCTNYGTVTGSGWYTAGINGKADAGDIIGCVNFGLVNNIKATGQNSYTGGIVGQAASATTTIANCVNYGDVVGANQSVGGIVGNTSGEVSNCVNHGNISGRQWVGGIMGIAYSNVTNCVNYGDVTGTADFIGGIVGASGGSGQGITRTLTGCVNHGDIKGVSYIGGIDGRPYDGVGTYESCINNGTITATGGYAGGILGRVDQVKATLIDCQSNGAVSGTKGSGLFFGYATAENTNYTLTNCTATVKDVFYIGYCADTKLPGGGITTDRVNSDKVDAVSGGFYDDGTSLKSFNISNIAMLKGLSLTNGEFTVLGTPNSGYKTGVIFGYSKTGDNESYYRFTVSDTDNRVYLDKVVNGVATKVEEYWISPKASGEYKFRIVLEDGKAYCYFWGERLWSVIDMDLTGTGVGLYAESVGAEFRSYSVTENATHTTVDTLIIGHSYMDFWSSYKYDLADVATAYNWGTYLNIGIGGTQSQHWLALKESVATYNPDLLIYMIGINDISNNRTPATIVADVESTLAYLKELNPDLNVILLSVNHSPSKTGKASEISQTNVLMKELCDKNDWIYLADLEYAFCDDGVNPTDSWFTSDGLHLAPKAYTDKVVPAIEAACRQIAEQSATKYTVKFVDEEGNILQESTLKYGEMPVFSGTLPTLPQNTAYCTYSGAWDKEISAVVGDVTYIYVITATYEKYTVKFVDENGALLYETLVEWGQTPVYNGIQPSKESTSEYVYQFAGWTPTLAAVTADAIYKATFTAIETPYDVIIHHLNLDGTKAADDYTAELTEEKLYSYTAPVVDGKQASHEHLNYRYEGKKILITIYYSEVSVWDGTSVSTEFVGEGTAENPYLISSGADLALLRERVNAGETYAGKYFKMTKSIDLNKVSLMIGKDYVAYGTEPTGGFAGIFDGNNCALLNIATKETEYNHLNGVFKAILTGGKVCNLSTYGELHQAINGTGVIAGNNFGTIENCTNYATISPAAGATISAIHRYSAGIVSVNNGSVISCVNYANVSGEEYACGIVSRMYKGTIENCINYGNMTGTGFREGGICGMADSGTIIGCVNYGDISGKSDVGGIVGTNKAVVSYCINYGSMVKGTGSLVGGIAGISYSAISNCINYGNVSAGSQYTGGIVGDMRANLSSCVNYGNITGTKEYAGGIIGGTSAALSDCENYGYIKGFDYAGGIVGYAKAAVSNCENHGEVSARQRVGGIAGSSTNNISKCINYSNVTGTADFVGGIVGASEGTTRTISGCVNNGAVKGVGYIGGIDGRPYTGTVTYDSCINNGTVTATYTSVDRGSAGGITGRSDSVMAILINCKSNGTVTAKSAGAYVGVHNASDTTGYVIYDSCSTILTGNAIGYDKTLTAPIPLEGFEYTKTEE